MTGPTASGFMTTSVTLGGNVTADGNDAITARGVVFALASVNPNPTVGGTGVTNLTSPGTLGAFTVNASGLTPGAVYSVRAYATNSVGTAYTLTSTFIVGDANQIYVAQLYLDVLHRQADANALQYYAGQLDGGLLTPGQVSSAVIGSLEGHVVEVDGVYQFLLGRTPEAGGMAAWTNYLATGHSLEQMLAAVFASPEFAARADTLQGGPDSNMNYVEELYQILLGRTGSPSEVAGWVATVGASGRLTAAAGFLGSGEFRTDFVEALYGGTTLPATAYVQTVPNLLRRTPAATEVSGWVQSSLDLLTIEAAIAGSPEYVAKA